MHNSLNLPEVDCMLEYSGSQKNYEVINRFSQVTDLVNKILICENNEFFLNSLRRMIQSYIPNVVLKFVLAQDECLAVTDIFKPDILILCSNLYSGNDLKTLKELRRNYPGVNIILFTHYDFDEYPKEAILHGANHTISRELWTGSEILDLLNTTLKAKDGKAQLRQQNESANEETYLQRSIERRRKDPQGKANERACLAGNPERRNHGTKQGLYKFQQPKSCHKQHNIVETGKHDWEVMRWKYGKKTFQHRRKRILTGQSKKWKIFTQWPCQAFANVKKERLYEQE